MIRCTEVLILAGNNLIPDDVTMTSMLYALGWINIIDIIFYEVDEMLFAFRRGERIARGKDNLRNIFKKNFHKNNR